ncbi:MAG: wax ester/triacylglycerol synthase family O-acyltransferase [Rudaea sp.]
MARSWINRNWIKPEDNYWWRAEEASDLYTIHSAMLFDEPLELPELRDWLAERIEVIERFRDRLVLPGGRLGLPYWEPYPEFKIEDHVHRLVLHKRIEHQDIEQLVGGMMSTPLDYSKPPWEMYLVEGEGSKRALISRLHHAMGDGLALIQLLLDLSGDHPGSRPPADGQEEPGFVSDLLGPARRTLKTGAALLKAGAGIAAHPRRALTWSIDAAAEWTWNFAIEPDPDTCLKTKAGIAKRAAWARTIPILELKALGRASGATLNDVVLTLLTGALRRYLRERGEDLGGQEIRALLPVNVRPAGSPPTLDNYFGMLGLSLPIQIADPAQRLEEMHARMSELKNSAAPSANYILISAMGLAPKEMQDALTRVVAARYSIMVTNVPGPSEPVELAGKQISNLVFWAPGAGKPGVAVSVLSYAGKLNVALATDVRRVPDPEAITRAFDEEYSAFCK